MRTALMLAALAASAAFAGDDGQAKKDLKALEGTWQYTSQEENGK